MRFPTSSTTFTTFVSLTSLWAIACGGMTSLTSVDGGSGSVEDAASNDDGRDTSTSCSGAVSFTMRGPAGKNGNYCVGRGCSLDWLEVTNNRGQVVPYGLGCNLSCLDCRTGGCDLLCRLPQPLKPSGESLIWDGRVWSSSSTCTDGRSCAAPTCATPGKYVARMCAAPNALLDAGTCRDSPNSAAQSCVEVEFEYPTAAPVVGVLP